MTRVDQIASQCQYCGWLSTRRTVMCSGCNRKIGVMAIDQMVYAVHDVSLGRIATLAHNLATGAALCKAFELGRGYEAWLDGWGEGWIDFDGPDCRKWEPGCEEVAPGFTICEAR